VFSQSKDPLIGRSLGEYQVARWLGGGGFARVYLAYVRRFPVALKVLEPTLRRTLNRSGAFTTTFGPSIR